MQSRLTATAFLLSLFLFIVGCSGNKQDGKKSSSDQLSVVTTTAMIADAAESIGGDRVQVISLMGPGSDPHLYNATAGDVTRLQDADLILYNGLHLEGKLDNVLEAVARNKPVVAVAERIPEDLRIHASANSEMYDPHVWFDIERWKYVAEAVEDALVDVDPDHAAGYRTNGSAYRDSLDVLDAWVRETLARVPENRRALITAHDAFTYFADAYDFEVHGLQGISTVSEAGTADIRRVSNLIIERDIPAIFVESSVPAKAIEAVQASVRSRGKLVEIGGELFSDAMGLPGTPEGTYIGMVEHNVWTIVNSLAPDAADTTMESERLKRSTHE